MEVVRYEDPALGAYKKLLIKENRLQGMILVGDVEDEYVYMDWMRAAGPILAPLRRQLLFPPRADLRARSCRYAGQRDHMRVQWRAQGRDYRSHPQTWHYDDWAG